VPIGKRTVGWVEEEVEAWIENRIAARDAIKRKGGPGRGHKGPFRRKSEVRAEAMT
jgi:Prophage CP4-57 regulatory protein (AlpA)